MRVDENGQLCPATLGEYRAQVAVLAPGSAAVEYLENWIAAERAGEKALAVASDREMRAVLMPKMGCVPAWDGAEPFVAPLDALFRRVKAAYAAHEGLELSVGEVMLLRVKFS